MFLINYNANIRKLEIEYLIDSIVIYFCQIILNQLYFPILSTYLKVRNLISYLSIYLCQIIVSSIANIALFQISNYFKSNYYISNYQRLTVKPTFNIILRFNCELNTPL
mgnify:CR=1 FL=1